MKKLIFFLFLINCIELQSQELFTQLNGWEKLPSGYSVVEPDGNILYLLRSDEKIKLVYTQPNGQSFEKELVISGLKNLVVLGSMIQEDKTYIFLRDQLFDFGNYNTRTNTSIQVIIWDSKENEASYQELVYSQDPEENFGASIITPDGLYIIKWLRTRIKEDGKKKKISKISIYHFKPANLAVEITYSEQVEGHEFVLGTINGEDFRAFLTKSGDFPEKQINLYRIEGSSITRKSFGFLNTEDSKYFESHYIFEEYRPDHPQAQFNNKFYLAPDLFIDPNKVQEFGAKKNQTRLLEIDWENSNANLLKLSPDLPITQEKTIKCYSTIYGSLYFTLYTTRNFLNLSVYDLNNLSRIKSYTINSTDPLEKLFYEATVSHEFTSQDKPFKNTEDLLQDISQGTPELFIFEHGGYLELEYYFPGSKIRLLPLILEGQFSESEFYLTTYLSNPGLDLTNNSWSDQKVPINRMVTNFIGNLDKSKNQLVPGLGYFKHDEFHLGVYDKEKGVVDIYSFKE